MATRESPRTNFAHLEAHDAQLVRLGMLAERYFADDPNTALLKLRQLAELLAPRLRRKRRRFARHWTLDVRMKVPRT